MTKRKTTQALTHHASGHSITSGKPDPTEKATKDSDILRICRSAAGYYIGRFSETEGPIARDSVEYWSSYRAAVTALKTGRWTLRRYH